jgi:hypothetical protein
LSYLVLLDRLQPQNKKGREFVTRSPFKSNLKVLQEHQTQLHNSTHSGVGLAISTGPPAAFIALSGLPVLEKLHLAQTLFSFFQSLIRPAKISALAGNYFVSAIHL